MYKTFSKAPSDCSDLKVTIENEKCSLNSKQTLNVSYNKEVQIELFTPLTWTTILYILTWKYDLSGIYCY